MTEQESLKQQVDRLQAIVDQLRTGELKIKTTHSTLASIRRNELEKYYGTWDQFRDTEISCVPYGKQWTDREFIQDGCRKLIDIIYKHGNDKNNSFNINSAVRTPEQFQEYKEITEYVFACVHNKVKELREKKGYKV